MATVNVPEVDVQFLRVEPDRVPELFDSVLGLGRSASSSDDDGVDYDGEDGWRYSDNRSLKGSVSNWDLDRLNTLTTSVYQGRFVTDDKPNRRHVTFLPVEGIKELQEPGIYIAVMSQPGRFRYEYQVSYFYVSDIGLHARRYSDRIEAYSVSLKSGQAISARSSSWSTAPASRSPRRRPTARPCALRRQLHQCAPDPRLARQGNDGVGAGRARAGLSEFDIGGHVSRPNNLFVYAGRNLYAPARPSMSVLPRDLDGRVMPPSPLTHHQAPRRPRGADHAVAAREGPAGLRRARHRSAAGRPDRHLAAGAARRPASRAPDASWKFQVEEFLPERMKMTLDTEQQVLSPDDELSIDVQGDYLYGAPAAGNRLLATFQVKRNRVPCRSNGPASSSATWPMTRAARSASCPNSRWTTTARPSSK